MMCRNFIVNNQGGLINASCPHSAVHKLAILPKNISDVFHIDKPAKTKSQLTLRSSPYSVEYLCYFAVLSFFALPRFIFVDNDSNSFSF